MHATLIDHIDVELTRLGSNHLLVQVSGKQAAYTIQLCRNHIESRSDPSHDLSVQARCAHRIGKDPAVVRLTIDDQATQERYGCEIFCGDVPAVAWLRYDGGSGSELLVRDVVHAGIYITKAGFLVRLMNRQTNEQYTMAMDDTSLQSFASEPDTTPAAAVHMRNSMQQFAWAVAAGGFSSDTYALQGIRFRSSISASYAHWRRGNHMVVQGGYFLEPLLTDPAMLHANRVVQVIASPLLNPI